MGVASSRALRLRSLGLRTALGLTFSLVSREAVAAGAVAIETWDSGEAQESVEAVGDAVARTDAAGVASSMAGNPDLDGSAWAHTGAFWVVQLNALPEVRIRVHAADGAELAPGLSVWATGAAAFDGGTTGFGTETSTAGFGTPHSFNAFGALGDPGTLWMQDGQGGNAQELLGYAVSGPSVVGMAGWGETIETGAYDARLTNDFASAVSGRTGAGFAELTLENVAAGWYLIYVGGTDHALAGGQFDLEVKAVPEPGAVVIQDWDSGEVEEHVESVGAFVTRSDVAGVASAMAGNPDLDGSAWAHTGSFWVVHLHDLPEVRIRVDAANASEFAPGLALWATGGVSFDGGTTGFATETSTAGFGTPHSFNAFGDLGDPGTLWMWEGDGVTAGGGNAQELLGYAVSGPSVVGAAGWGETIEHGAHDTRLTDTHAAAVSGDTGTGFAELTLEDVARGWYLLYVGGTDHALAGGQFDVEVVAVPEPGALPAGLVALATLLALRGRGGRKR
jgi:hypothetical protein